MNQNLFLKSINAGLSLVMLLLCVLALNDAYAAPGDLGVDQFQAQEARRYQQVRVGVIEDIRMVQITREASSNTGYVGAGIGAVVGGLLGNQVGQGNGRTAATALAGTIGGLVGKMAGESVGREVKNSAEIIVSLNNGNVVSIVQEMDQVTAALQPGDRVRLIEGQAIRVVPMRSI